MRFRKSAHAIYKTEYHLVWIPRYRRKIFVKGVKEYAEKILLHIFELDPDIEVIKVNVQEDHVHMVIVIPPRIAVANAIQFIKTRSAKALKVVSGHEAIAYRV
jgi:putative transposase